MEDMVKGGAKRDYGGIWLELDRLWLLKGKREEVGEVGR